MRFPEASHRDLRLDSRTRFGGLDAFATSRGLVELDDPLGTRVPGENRVHGDPVAGDLVGERPREARYCRTKAIRQHEVGYGLLRGNRSNGENSAPAAFLHPRQNEPCEFNGTREEESCGVIPLLEGE